MIVLLDIKEDKVAFMMELIDSLNFVEANPLSTAKA